MADFTFTLKDATGNNITSPISQNNAIALDVASNGDITYSTYTTAIDTVDIEVRDETGAPDTAPVKFTPSTGDKLRIETVSVVQSGGTWGVTDVSASDALTLCFGVTSVGGRQHYEWSFTGSGSGGGVAKIEVKVKSRRIGN